MTVVVWHYHRNQAAQPGIITRRLLPRHPRTARPLQTPCRLRNRAANQRHTRRTRRPLRPARTTRQNPHRKPPPAARRKRIGYRRHRRDQRSRYRYLRQTPPNRPDRNHPTDSDR